MTKLYSGSAKAPVAKLLQVEGAGKLNSIITFPNPVGLCLLYLMTNCTPGGKGRIGAPGGLVQTCPSAIDVSAANYLLKHRHQRPASTKGHGILYQELAMKAVLEL